jgi:hypothetical protein
MALLYREIKLPRWKLDSALPPDSDFPSDCFGDLATQHSALSFWLDEQSDPELIAVAVAANKPTVKQVDLLGLDPTIIDGLGVEVQSTIGNSRFAQVNHLHRDVANLTAFKLLKLANRMAALGEVHTFLPKKIAQLLKTHIDAGKLDASKIERSLLDRIHSMTS